MQQINTDNTEVEILPCLIIPVQGGRLILPNVTVAEIIPNQLVAVIENLPEWFLGQTEWRGTMIPIISYDIFCGQTTGAFGQNIRIAVVNAPNGDDGSLRFFGLVVQGIPSLVKLEEAAIQENLNTDLKKGQKMAVTVESGHAIVPDLEMIEDAIKAENWQS